MLHVYACVSIILIKLYPNSNYPNKDIIQVYQLKNTTKPFHICRESQFFEDKTFI